MLISAWLTILGKNKILRTISIKMILKSKVRITKNRKAERKGRRLIWKPHPARVKHNKATDQITKSLEEVTIQKPRKQSASNRK